MPLVIDLIRSELVISMAFTRGVSGRVAQNRHWMALCQSSGAAITKYHSSSGLNHRLKSTSKFRRLGSVAQGPGLHVFCESTFLFVDLVLFLWMGREESEFLLVSYYTDDTEEPLLSIPPPRALFLSSLWVVAFTICICSL